MRGQEGAVVLSLLIGADGRVRDISVQQSSGYPLLDEAAIKAVQRWHFHPATRGGVALDWQYLQPIKFSLSD